MKRDGAPNGSPSLFVEHFAKCWQKKAIHGAITALVRMRFRLNNVTKINLFQDSTKH